MKMMPLLAPKNNEEEIIIQGHTSEEKKKNHYGTRKRVGYQGRQQCNCFPKCVSTASAWPCNTAILKVQGFCHRPTHRRQTDRQTETESFLVSAKDACACARMKVLGTCIGAKVFL